MVVVFIGVAIGIIFYICGAIYQMKQEAYRKEEKRRLAYQHQASEAERKRRERIRQEEERRRRQEEKDRQRDDHSRFVHAERRKMTDSLRYDILRRDGFRCQLCGATQKDGYRLHVDHIIPVSRGGQTVPSNLRTLCERCNMGKSDKLE